MSLVLAPFGVGKSGSNTIDPYVYDKLPKPHVLETCQTTQSDTIVMVKSIILESNPEIDLGVAYKYAKWMTVYSKENGTDLSLALAVSHQETGGTFDNKPVSSAGAKGLFGIMPSMGKFACDTLGIENCKLGNPKNNINIGTWFINFIVQKEKNVLLALAQYNGGNKQRKHYESYLRTGRPGQLARETKNYVSSVLRKRDEFKIRLSEL